VQQREEEFDVVETERVVNSSRWPEMMTAVSKPNRRPPNAPTDVLLRTYLLIGKALLHRIGESRPQAENARP
jgi:hypothetical protein